MSDERPLHVRVAEALGWKAVERRRGEGFDLAGSIGDDYTGIAPTYQTDLLARVPRYDTSWSATGPLIERYGILVGPTIAAAYAGTQRVGFVEMLDGTIKPRLDDASGLCSLAGTPLIAVCELILALKAAGKL